MLHQAAIPSVPRSVAEPLASFESGPTASMNLLEAARQAGVERVVFAASSSAYGDTEELPKHEAMVPNPLSPYAAGKLASEHYIRVYARTMGLDGVSLRYFNVFGPRQDPSSPYSGVISLFAKLMSAGTRPAIYGDGGQTRDFTYIDNVVRANLLALDAPAPLRGEVFNVGTGEQTSLLDLVAAINATLGTEPRTGVPPRAGRRRPALAGRARPDQGDARLRADGRVRRGAPADPGGDSAHEWLSSRGCSAGSRRGPRWSGSSASGTSGCRWLGASPATAFG